MKGETGMNRNGKDRWEHSASKGRPGQGREQTTTGAPNVLAGKRAEQRRSGFLSDVEPWPERVKGRELLDELAATLKRFVFSAGGFSTSLISAPAVRKQRPAPASPASRSPTHICSPPSRKPSRTFLIMKHAPPRL